MEFTDVGATARSLLPFALISYAEVDPAKARETAVRLSIDLPDDMGIYMAAGLAALWLEEIGTPDDKWEQIKTMYAAINRAETVAQKLGVKRPDMVINRALFQIMAGDVDGARQNLAASISQYPDHVPTMLMLADMALTLPADTKRARELYNLIAKVDPKNPRLLPLDAQIKAAEGKWVEAAAVYERMIAEEPRNSGAYAARIAALESAKQPDAALKVARDWYARIPEDARSIAEVVRLLAAAGNKSEALKLADEYVAKRVADARKAASEIQPPLKPAELEKVVDYARGSALLATASGFFRAKVYDEAEARSREVHKIFPTADRPILMLGDIAIVKKNWDAALAAVPRDSQAEPAALRRRQQPGLDFGRDQERPEEPHWRWSRRSAGREPEHARSARSGCRPTSSTPSGRCT